MVSWHQYEEGARTEVVLAASVAVINGQRSQRGKHLSPETTDTCGHYSDHAYRQTRRA